MGILIAIIIIITVPVFYIVGLVQTIKWIIGQLSHPKPNQSSPLTLPADQWQIQHIKTAITETELQLQHHPNATLHDHLAMYQRELAKLTSQPIASTPSASVTTPPSSSSILHQPIQSLWQQWYATNSINLLLYIGALLIVLSAAIFTAFQWEVLSGSLKALLLSAVMITFLISGLTFYKLPKIKQAGEAFTGIGAILLPLAGAGWYNFVLREAGLSLGTAWLAIAAISLTVYIILLYYLKSSFYTYMASLAGIGLSLSLVRIGGLPNDTYILAGMISSFILLLASRLKTSAPISQVNEPLQISSVVLMPLFLLGGLCIALAQDRLFSWPAALSLTTAAGYYCIFGHLWRQSWATAIGLILLPTAVLSAGQAAHLDHTSQLFILAGIGLGYTLASVWYQQQKATELADSLAVIGLAILSGVTVSSWGLNLANLPDASYALLTAIGCLITGWSRRRSILILPAILTLSISLFFIFKQLVGLDNNPYMLGALYLLGALIIYVLQQFLFRTHRHLAIMLSLGWGWLTFLAVIAGSNQPWFLATVSLLALAMSIGTARQLAKAELYYLVATIAAFGWWSLLRALNVQTDYYPLAFSAIAYLVYTFSLVAPPTAQQPLRRSGLTIVLSVPIISWYSFHTLDISSSQLWALTSAYLATTLYAAAAWQQSSSRLGYIASVIGMITYWWQINFIGLTNPQWYTLPFGVYLLALAATRPHQDQPDSLEIAGLAVLLLPTFFQTFGQKGPIYALILAAEGIVLVAVGISWRHKLYRLAGVVWLVLAVLTQTYGYIAALPKWLLMGILGLLFLVVAVTLLLRRKDQLS